MSTPLARGPNDGVRDDGRSAPLGSKAVAPDCRGEDFFALDASLRSLLDLYMDGPLREHMWPHLQRLGRLAGDRLDELAAQADRNPPTLQARDRFGRDQEWIEYHPAYREMERIAFDDFGLHAMSHRAGVLGWSKPVPPIAKYAFQYLFVQAEFGLMCPVSLSDTSAHLLRRYGDRALRRRYLDRMLSQDPGERLSGTQFMTEKVGGSDVSRLETVAVAEGDAWRLYGEKWFCSHTDADLAMLLARPEGAPEGTRGLALFLMPRTLEDGSRNAYRIVRLKEKLGTRSMASGEVRLEGALAYAVGSLDKGLRQMLDQVNLSRLSHGVRAAAMMRRCWNEARCVARARVAFGRPLDAFPLMRRQLMKILLPTEHALSMMCYTARVMHAAGENNERAGALLRILTPLFKLRACRDNIRVATAAMEVRGGNGYVEDWVSARLVRDAHVGVLWEGTSSIVALDLIQRAVGKKGAHTVLHDALGDILDGSEGVPETLRDDLASTLQRAVGSAERVATDPGSESLAREAASALYDAASAVLLAAEGAALAGRGGDARRLLLARMVLEHRLGARDPLEPAETSGEQQRIAHLLSDTPIPRDKALGLLAA
jgi:alkylation response protein AidB-like acyl-CoA dehydrogenase